MALDKYYRVNPLLINPPAPIPIKNTTNEGLQTPRLVVDMHASSPPPMLLQLGDPNSGTTYFFWFSYVWGLELCLQMHWLFSVDPEVLDNGKRSVIGLSRREVPGRCSIADNRGLQEVNEVNTSSSLLFLITRAFSFVAFFL